MARNRRDEIEGMDVDSFSSFCCGGILAEGFKVVASHFIHSKSLAVKACDGILGWVMDEGGISSEFVPSRVISCSGRFEFVDSEGGGFAGGSILYLVLADSSLFLFGFRSLKR